MTKLKEYRGTPISIEVTKIESRPGCWNVNKVEVYYSGNKIGEYVRGYPSFTERTFFPFKIEEDWYALYSADYTATRVAKLTETEFIDWCGEEGSAVGFCPVEFYVPRYCKFIVVSKHNGKEFEMTLYDDYRTDEGEEEYFNYPNTEGFLYEKFCNYGFLSGCIWGDDRSWKLKYIDLSKIPEKELLIDERFGYFELPDLPLRECIVPESDYLTLIQQKTYSLTGNKFYGD